jgi:hypothetical protein
MASIIRMWPTPSCLPGWLIAIGPEACSVQIAWRTRTSDRCASFVVHGRDAARLSQETHVHLPGLYYPYIHVRDDEWLKAAALYWPSIRRLVPGGYSTHDGPTASAFSSAGILRDVDPSGFAANLGPQLCQAIMAQAPHMVRRFSIDMAEREWRGQRWGDSGSLDYEFPWLGWIHLTKIPGMLRERLIELGLAYQGRPEHSDRLPSGQRPREWVGLHPALAGAYMQTLATVVSEQASFQPLTDQADLRLAASAPAVESALQLLVGRSNATLVPDTDVDRYVMLAIQTVIPSRLQNIPAEKIIEIREQLAEELTHFRDYVETQREELANIAATPHIPRQLEMFAQHFDDTIRLPLERLERGLALHKLEPTRQMLVAGVAAPPALAQVALGLSGAAPAIVTTTGSVAAIGTMWWQVSATRKAQRRSSPAAYLLGVRDALTPATIAAAMSRFYYGVRRRGPSRRLQ